MSDAGCVFCSVIAALERSDTCPAAEAGQVLRKVRDLPASIAILAPDQYYKGYTMVVSKTHATELFELPERQGAQYYQDMVAVAKAIATAFRPRRSATPSVICTGICFRATNGTRTRSARPGRRIIRRGCPVPTSTRTSSRRFAAILPEPYGPAGPEHSS